MGCFSWQCSYCYDPIKSTSMEGEHCVLILMVKGEVREYMAGPYDSYGRVFLCFMLTRRVFG